VIVDAAESHAGVGNAGLRPLILIRNEGTGGTVVWGLTLRRALFSAEASSVNLRERP
jgi:hypothetical protein